MIQTGPQFQPGRFLLNLIAVFCAGIVLWPLVGLITEGAQGLIKGSANLGIDGPQQIKGTLTLLIGTSVLGGMLGTANGWLLANCRFPGRKTLRIAQLLPLATPPYLLSAILIDLGSRNAIRINGMVWGIIIMALTTYPYVFLLSTESFAICGRRQLEACRSLGTGPWNSFRRIALPIALPAIGAGIALMGMEVVNELGAVELLNIPSISAGISENWGMEGNPAGAIGLSMVALIIVMSLVAYERSLRNRSKRWTEGVAGGESPAWQLYGARALSAQLVGATPPIVTLGLPILWAVLNADQLKQGIDPELGLLTARSFGLGLSAAIITLLGGLILSIAKRWTTSKLINALSFIAGIGYAIPGAVLAIALMPFTASRWNLITIIVLIWGYGVRFLLVTKGGLDAAFERLSPNLDEAATALGFSWPKVLQKVHLPLLKGPLLVGALLVFVDTVKELPLTFVLRIPDFDTLSVRLFVYLKEERIGESILPALLIISLGLLASLALIPGLSNSNIEDK
ncbi:iron ABC transporter permease [Prochlorococcus sp. MIT 1300]|uniref:ABC transporter permease n=1 Tax=Prochlorococcus sp. MIT 1300 TaxID=3096218 RepID=UPI002A7626E1|nr:iron ABC transporter permease [Prochlorococcus sp. MIT 1300]